MRDKHELALLIAEARANYYRGRPTISDDQYDVLEAQLKDQDPDHPLLKTIGAPPSNTLKKVKHASLVGSLENSFDEDSIVGWVKRVNKSCSPKWCVAQPKCDGLTVVLTYKNGTLVRAATRGDGKEGEDVTAGAMAAAGCVPTLPYRLNCEVRCEAVLTKVKFAKYFKDQDYSNPRNAAAGTLRRKDAKGADHLRLIAFDIQSESDDGYGTETEALEMLRRCGFRVVQWHRIPFTVEAITASWKDFLAKREEMKYDIDGCVVKLNERVEQKTCGWTDTCPVGMRALKWRGQMLAESVLVGVDNSVGQTGTITPVAVITPVDCGGVTVTNVSLMNWDEIARLEKASGFRLGMGSKVRIERAGDVIPRILAVLSAPTGEPLARPDRCPSCNDYTVEDGPRQKCDNPDCPAQSLRKVMKWIKGRNIMHLGEETLDKLMAIDGMVQSPVDLYTIHEDDLAPCCGGYVVARKIIKEVEKSRACTPAQLLGNICIRGIGETEAAKVTTAVDLSTFKAVVDIDKKVCKRILGAKRGEDFFNGIVANISMIEALYDQLDVANPAKSDKVTKAWDGRTFCATGALSVDREAFKAIICAAGGVWKSSVVKGLDFLITNEGDSGTTKMRDARAKGVTVIDEATALDMAGLK